MSMEELKDREVYFKEFGELLVRRHEQNYYSSFHNQSRVTVDETALRFGCYIHAARLNSGYSIAKLAALTKLSAATLTALEQGLILACDIKPKWLKEIAKTLDESIEDFNLLLGRQISSGNSRWLTERLKSHWQHWLSHSPLVFVSKPIYAACSALLIFFMLGAISILGLNTYPQPQPRPKYSYIDVQPEHRLNMIRSDLRIENQILLLSAHLGGGNCCIY